MRWEAVVTFLEKLTQGDPVAWSFVAGFLLLAGLIVLIGLRMQRANRREDEQRKNKWLKKPPQK